MNATTRGSKPYLHLKPLALAAILFGAGSSAQADLVGHWLKGDPNLSETSGAHAVGTHDGVAVGTNAGSLAFSTDVPAGFSGRSLDLIGNVGVSVANSSTADGVTYQNTYDGGIGSRCTIAFWAKGFPGNWNPWVAKRGENTNGTNIGWQLRRYSGNNVATFTLRGVANEDAPGSPIDVATGQPAWHHFAGVWDQATGTRHLYVDGAFSHTTTSTPGDDMALAANQRLTLGARADGGTGYGNYFTGKLYDVRIYNTPLTQAEILALVLQVPTGLVAGPANGKVGLAWTPTPRATGYTVWTKNTVTEVEVTDTTTDAFFTKTGLDNGTPYRFKVMATNSSGTSAYSAAVDATPVLSSANDILTFSFGAYGSANISGTNITKYLPSNIDLANLAPTYTTSMFATGSPVSGTARDFTFPQTYTITAEDNTTKDYTVTVALVSPITYDFTGGLQGWTQLQPTLPAVLWQGDALGSGYDGIAPDDTYTRFGRSPLFYLLDSGPLTFSLNGGQSPLSEPHVGPSAIPAEAIQNGGFAGVALRDVATDTYVLSRRKTPSANAWQQFQFTPAELAPFVNNGKQYTLDYIDYNRGGWGWTYMDNVSIPGVAVEPGTEALITSIRITPASVPQVSQISGTNITVWLPYGTSINALSPLIAVSPGATLSPPLGTVRDFTTPQTYTVTSGNSAASNEYTVTVVAAGSLNVKTYDTTSDALNLDPISNLMALTPSATGTQVADIFYGNFAASLPGVTANDTFSVLWEGWFDVTKDGPGDYTFGAQSDDGSVIYLDLNNDGDFTDPGELVVNNNGLHGMDQARTASVYLPMDSVRIAIGYFEATGGEGIDARFQRGKGIAFTSLQRIGGRTGHFRATEPAPNPASSSLWYVTSSGRVAQPYGSPTQLLLLLPAGTDVTNLAPAFTLSPGATCVPPLGTPVDFTSPQTYTVTAQDGFTTTEYTIKARAATPVSVKTYATTAGTGFLAPISNLQAVTPSGSGEIYDDIKYASDASFVALPGLVGLTPVNGFSVLWEGWFNVAADGPGDYTFGTRSDDGSVLYLDLSNDGDFDDPGELIVNNNLLQGATTRTATVKLLMDKVRFAIGYFDNGGNKEMEARFGKGSGVAWENLLTVSGNTGLFSIAEPASKPSSAALWYFNYAGTVAVPTNPEGTNLLLVLPLGHDVTQLDPEFNISPGAVCTPPSGTELDFSTPQTYSVTSENSSTTTEYTVTIYTGQVYDFNDGSLQGWRNIVWDLGANGGAGGWVELAPNATTLPATVNGGAIQPPSVDNGLFGINTGEVYPNGHFDNHLNTHWLRSPAFYLHAAADLTLQLRRGVAHTADPANEAAVPNAAVTGGGWKGAVLRRVSDGAFLLAKPRTGTNGDEWRTITFTKAELTPYVGVACTLDLINSDRGSWGWVSMDNVFIPATSLVPAAPYDSWRAQYPTLVGAAGAPDGNPDGDALKNIEEYAYGTNPITSTGEIAYVSNGSVTPGAPKIVAAGGTYSMVFGRRADYLAAGLTYTVQFSAGLDEWVDNNDGTNPPVQVATDGTINAMSVPFVDFITTPGSGTRKPTFARVKVELAP